MKFGQMNYHKYTKAMSFVVAVDLIQSLKFCWIFRNWILHILICYVNLKIYTRLRKTSLRMCREKSTISQVVSAKCHSKWSDPFHRRRMVLIWKINLIGVFLLKPTNWIKSFELQADHITNDVHWKNIDIRCLSLAACDFAKIENEHNRRNLGRNGSNGKEEREKSNLLIFSSVLLCVICAPFS